MQEISEKKHTKYGGASKRMIQFLENKGISRYSFYKKLKFSNRFLESSENMGTDRACKILSYYPEINPAWLLMGREPMRLEEEEKPSAVSDPAPVYKGVPAASVNIIEINPQAAKTNTLIADVHASAGFGSLMESTKALEQLPAIHLPNAPHGLNVAFQINGDSMHPTIRHLDYVAGNQINDVNSIREGHTYIIIDRDDGVLCKRVYKLGNDWQIVSDNPIHRPYNRKSSRIIAFFKAFCRWSYDFRHYHGDVRDDIQLLTQRIDRIENNR